MSINVKAVMDRIGDLGVRTSPSQEYPFLPSVTAAAQVTGRTINQ